jgi:hypothetical protein
MVQLLHKDIKDGTILEKTSTEATAIYILALPVNRKLSEYYI